MISLRPGTPSDHDVRPATVGDAELLAALNRHVHDVHQRAEPTLYRATDPQELRAWYAQRLSDPSVVVFVAHADRPLGYALTVHAHVPMNPFSPPRERLLLDELAVVPDQRRRGVGRALMAAVERRAVELGIHSVQLDVRAFNTDALRFYESLGYAPAQLRLERSAGL